MKSSGVGGGSAGSQAYPQKFWFAENLGKSLNTWLKIAPNVVWLQKMAPTICIKIHEDLFFRAYTKKKSSWSLWEKICRQKLHKNISGKFGEIRAKSFAPQKFACSYTWWKGIFAPVALFWKSRNGNVLSCLHSPASLCIPSTRTLFTPSCKLQCVTAMNIKYQRSPETEHFMTAKISGKNIRQRWSPFWSAIRFPPWHESNEETKARKHDHSWASAEIFSGGATSTFCLSFSNSWRSVFALTQFYTEQTFVLVSMIIFNELQTLWII